MKGLLFALTALCCLSQLSSGQMPLDPINCETETAPPTLDYPLGPIGSYKVLWVMCAPDSGALAPLDSLSIERPICPAPTRRRVMYPSTYQMPPWANQMLDPNYNRSLATYYSDISFGQFLAWGDVVGDTNSTIFRSHPDTSVRPLQPYTCWGNNGGSAFFLNIMPKVDRVVNFADYDLNGSGVVDFLVFNIYGLAEDGNFQGTGGVASLPASFLSTDTTVTGQRILVSDGCVIWSPSPEAYMSMRGMSQFNAELQSFWENHGIAAHEVGHRVGGFTPHRGFLGCYEIMGNRGNFVNPQTWIIGPTSPYNPQYRLGYGWIDPIVVDRPNFSYEMPDHLSSGATLKLPAYRSTTNDQYFLALASTRESVWETYFPASGVMIPRGGTRCGCP